AWGGFRPFRRRASSPDVSSGSRRWGLLEVEKLTHLRQAYPLRVEMLNDKLPGSLSDGVKPIGFLKRLNDPRSHFINREKRNQQTVVSGTDDFTHRRRVRPYHQTAGAHRFQRRPG